MHAGIRHCLLNEICYGLQNSFAFVWPPGLRAVPGHNRDGPAFLLLVAVPELLAPIKHAAVQIWRDYQQHTNARMQYADPDSDAKLPNADEVELGAAEWQQKA